MMNDEFLIKIHHSSFIIPYLIRVIFIKKMNKRDTPYYKVTTFAPLSLRRTTFKMWHA